MLAKAEQQQPDEDVGAVQAGEAVEDRAEGAVAGAEADVDVLVDLDEEEGRAEQPGRREAQLAAAVAPADDSSAQCIVKLEETRIAVLTPATATGSSKPSGGHAPSSATTRRKK